MKNYKKYSFFLDRFPYILLILIIGFSILFFIIVRNNLPLNFFSGLPEDAVSEEEYTIFITSPNNNQEFELVNRNETVPVEIKAKEIEDLDYILKVYIDDNDVKTFRYPPFEFNWLPDEPGKYLIEAKLFDENNNIISTSNRVEFSIKYALTEDKNTTGDSSIEEKKARILTESQYRSQNGPPIFSYKCLVPPAIDGNLDQWDKFEKFSDFVPTIKKENYTTPSDLSGTFYSCWDDENFYFAIRVIDDVYSQNYTGEQLNKGDSISMVIDTDLEGDMHIPFLNEDDYQIDFSAGNFSNIKPEAFMRWPTNSAPKDVKIGALRLGDGYIIEASIPWYNFNYTPQDEHVLGFTVSILDTDHLETTELVISSSVQFDFNNVFTLGTLVLIDVEDITEEAE